MVPAAIEDMLKHRIALLGPNGTKCSVARRMVGLVSRCRDFREGPEHPVTTAPGRFDNLSHWGRRLRDLDVTEFEEVLGDLATRWPFLSL